MGLSRLNNFLKSAKGTILYVDPNSLDSTDSIENSGNSLTRPFKTIQRALIESARFSYQRGQNNDRFNKTTILLYPGDHLVDNRPGYIPTGNEKYTARSGEDELTDLTQWDLDTIFDLSSPDNPLYKLNSIHGGVIVPRGTSIVGMDLRKTKVRPLYVPNPSEEDGINIERSCIFRVTGACYFWQFTILDSDPNGFCYKDYTKSKFVPNFSHHKLTGFEYADGVNSVDINDTFLTYSTSRTDLDMYYEKVAAVYGPSSSRQIEPDYGNGTVDIQPVIDEYRIVGPKGASIGISSIRSGDGETSSTTITVNLITPLPSINVDSPIKISGVGAEGYDGQFVVSTVSNFQEITYKVQNPPTDPSPNVSSAFLDLVVDTVTSASPYIFNISLRSVYGMCGLLADGDKATGFKSMVVAQYTGIGLQKDDNAFVKYDSVSGEYKDSRSVINLHTDSRAVFKPSYENFHIKATNDAFIQSVSVFAIGYAQHFVAENGGDIAINNSNSNFGAKSLVSSGFKRFAFPQDDSGYVTHIIPPKEINTEEIGVEFVSIDVDKTIGVSTNRLYLYNENNEDNPPKVVIDGYRIGAKYNDLLNLQINQSGISSVYSSRIVMPLGSSGVTDFSSEKVSVVGRSQAGINSITANSFVFTENHYFTVGESVRIISSNGHLPDGVEYNTVYYAIPNEDNQIQIAKTYNDALNGSEIQINNKGGSLQVISRVSDKNPGYIGHPVQWDPNNGGCWYITVSNTNNGIYSIINTLGTSSLGNATNRTYVTRKIDNRSLNDTLYRIRYVIPKNSPSTSRSPVDGFILQESNNIIGSGEAEISQLYNNDASLTNSNELRNPKFIANASWNSNVATITSEIPHNLKVGDEIEVSNVIPDDYNGTYTITSIPTTKQFTYSLVGSAPSSFGNDTSSRDENLPYFSRKRHTKTYQIYRTEEIQPYLEGIQDGIYYLTIINHSNRPTVTPFRDLGFAQPISNLYPQTNKDNPTSDPESSSCHSLPSPIGQVVINDSQNSITKETLESFIVGTGITDIKSSSGTSHTIYTSIDHGFSGITSVSIVNQGNAYGSGSLGSLYNAQLVGFAGSTTGSNATAKITIDGAGAITSIKIIDGGSAYGIGNTLRVVGVATTTGHIVGVVKVETVTNNSNDTIKIVGVASTYNNLYRISSISVGKPKEINVVSSSTISNISSSGIGSTATANSFLISTGKALTISSLTYNTTTRDATVTFNENHGLRVDNKIRISGANESVFNGDFIVKRLNSLTSVEVNVGIATTSTNATGTLYAYRQFLTSYDGDLVKDTENTSGRLSYNYAGITTTITSSIVQSGSDETALNISNAVSVGFKLGDYILIDNEIFRIRQDVSSNSVEVFRSVLGSPRQFHSAGSVVRKIKVFPVELRRNSIIRASGHTFEYLGYGPGNYSTSLPDKQNRSLSSQEKFLSQATKVNGGIVVYTGMNSEGDFFAGNKKINSATGKEETFDTPFPSITGEKKSDTLFNITETQKLFVTDSIKVDGGKDKNIVTEFDGPLVLNNKLKSNSDIETNSIFIQGTETVSRKFSLSKEIPTISGNSGDVVFNSIPADGGTIGWTYTVDNEWKPFGVVGVTTNSLGISSEGTYIGNANAIDLYGSGEGFGLNIVIDFNSVAGVASITFDIPVDFVNFGENVLQKGYPSFATTSLGSRIIYENTVDSTNTNYAVGIGPDESLWHSIPNTQSTFSWYVGESRIGRLTGNGSLFINNDITSSRFISTVSTGTAPVSVASSTLVTNFNSQYLQGLVPSTSSLPNTIPVRNSSNVISGNVSHLVNSTQGAQTGDWYADIPSRLGYTPFNRAGDTATGICTFPRISDIYSNVSTAGTTLTCNFNNGPITRTTSSNIAIIDITNVPTTDQRAFNHTVIINSSSIVSSLSSIQFRINGTSVSTSPNTIRWLNGVSPSGTAAGYYFMGFSIFRVGSAWEVLGTFATYS
jgi:hypothetical protein